jgi:hypothetical protein
VREKIVRLRLGFAKAVVIGALGVAAVGLVAAPASASGTSSRTNGCYAKWWTTAFAGYCDPTTSAGAFRLVGICNNEWDIYLAWDWFGKGEYVSPFENDQCTFSVTKSYVEYTAG